MIDWNLLKEWGIIPETFPYPPNKARNTKVKQEQIKAKDTTDWEKWERKLKKL